MAFFDVETVKHTHTIEPIRHMKGFQGRLHIRGFRQVRGTPLLLVPWLKIEGGGSVKLGSVFTLVDQEGKPVWALRLDDDCMAVRGRAWEVTSMGRCILATDKHARFDIHLMKLAKRVSFVVDQEEGAGWRVREESRQPYSPPRCAGKWGQIFISR